VTYSNRIEGGADQGERANDRKALATKETSRRSGARAGTVDESYLGRSRLTSERKTVRRTTSRSEKSAAAVVAAGFGEGGPPQCEGPNGEESEPTVRHARARHQKSMKRIELPLEDRGEASSVERSDEAPSTRHDDERSGLDHELVMERVIEGGNLRRALKRVQQNEGSPGVDGLTVEELPAYLREHWATIRERLLTGRYQPSVVKRVEIPKPGGGVRQLGIPTVLDRFIQQAVLQIVQPAIDPTFSESSYGFRPGRSAQDAVCQAQRYVQSGRRWVVDVDLEQFFDRVNHDILMGLVAKRSADPRVLRLIRRYLEAGVLVTGVAVDRHEGTPQGGPLSPLLANVLLDVVDKQLERRGHRFVRYADDCNVYVQSKRAAQRVMVGLTRLYANLKLRVNPAKSAVAPARERSFLGYSFWYARGKIVKRRVAPKALKKMKERVREITSRSGGRSLTQVVALLRSYLAGWKAYFRLADTPGIFTDVDQWLHRRLRMLILKHHKRGTTLYRTLRARGVPNRLALAAAAHCTRWWAMATHGALKTAFPTQYFIQLGVPRLGPS
jgi:RNA-directed DNA polymerase